MDLTHSLLEIAEGASFTLGDASTGSDALVLDGDLKIKQAIVANKGIFVLNGGKITRNTKTTSPGGGVHVYTNALFTMNNGEVSY